MLQLKTLLNVLAILAIAQAAVKILEMVLDSRQTLAFQKATDNLTLTLIDLDPIRHYRRLREHKVQIKWLAAVLLFFYAITLFISVLEVRFNLRALLLQTSASDVIFYISVPIVFYVPFRCVLWWFGSSKTIWTLLGKAAFIGLLCGLGAIFEDDLPARYNSASGLFLGFCFYSAAVVALLYVAQAAVWLFRHILWRIATDARGAWSATLFLVAALLALAATLVPKQ